MADSRLTDNNPSRLSRRFSYLFLFFAGALVISAHALDFRSFNEDVNYQLEKSLDWIDIGVWHWQGNVIWRDFRAGPLLPFLMAVPLFLWRSVESVYWFVSLEAVLACFIFHRAQREIAEGDRLVLWVGTLAFSSSVLSRHIPIDPTGEKLVFLFVAIYYYALVKSVRTDAFLLAAWAAIALCVDVHFSTIILVPITFIAGIPYSGAHRKLWTLAGLVAFVFLIYPLNIQLLDAIRFGWSPGAAAPATSGGTLLLDSLKSLAIGIVSFPLVLGTATSVFAVLGMWRWRAVSKTAPQWKPLYYAGFCGFAIMMIGFPILWGWRGRDQPDYFSFFAVFGALFASLFFRQLRQTQQRPGVEARAFFVFRLLLAPVLMIAAGSIAANTIFQHGDLWSRLDTKTEIAERAVTIIREKTRSSLATRLLEFSGEPGNFQIHLQPENSTSSLLRILDPTLAGRIQPAGENELLVVLGRTESFPWYVRKEIVEKADYRESIRHAQYTTHLFLYHHERPDYCGLGARYATDGSSDAPKRGVSNAPLPAGQGVVRW